MFSELNRRGVRYAVLRNYERFPTLARDGDPTTRTDVDLVVDSRHVPIWREIAKDIAQREGWHVLTECDHWMQSSVRHHNIEIFRFYRLSPLEFLQVDLFHGFNLYGVPLLDEEALLDGSAVPPGRTFLCIDPAKENLFRLPQIYGLAQVNREGNKIARYRHKVLHFWSANREQLEEIVRKNFSTFGLRALEALEQEDFDRFSREMKLAKTYFFVKFLLRHPARSPAYLISRTRDNRKRFVTRQCGCVINVYAPEEKHRELLRRTLHELAELNVFAHWKEKETGSPITGGHRAAMEQGCPVIQWSSREDARMDLSESIDPSLLPRELIRILVHQDTVLFSASSLADWTKTATPKGTL